MNWMRRRYHADAAPLNRFFASCDRFPIPLKPVSARNSAMAGEGMGSAEIRNGLTGQQVWAGLCRAGLKSFPGAVDVF